MIRKTKITFFVLFLILTLGFSIASGTTLTEINNQISETESQLEQGKEEEANMGDEISDIEARISGTQEEINVLATAIDSAHLQIEQKTIDLEEKEADLEENIEGLNQRLRNMYKSGSLGFLDVLLSSEDVNEFISNFDLVQEIYQSDRKMVAELEREHKEIEEERDQLVALENTLKIQEAELKDKETALAADKAILEEKLAEIANNNTHLQEDLEALNAQAAEIQSIINSQSEYQGGPGSGTLGGSGSGRLGWPVQGYYQISSGYGWRTSPLPPYEQSKHTGIDIPGPVGTPILAAEAGKVIAAYYNVSYGNVVIISHGNGIWTLYAHNSALYVMAGDVVSRGQSIAGMGSTGDSTGSHCHFEVRTSEFWGSDVDPMGYL